MRVDILTPGYFTSKALLFQCKRMYPPLQQPRFDEIPGRGERQARDMLAITPASFFLLFNFGEQQSLADLAWGDFQRSAEWFWGRPWHDFEIGGAAFDLGVAIVPAARILGLSEGASMTNGKFPTEAATILAGASPLGVFMADLVCSCLVGDTRPMVRQLVTAPAQHAINEGASGRFFDYHVNRYLHITVTTEEEVF
ncbi:hypothetical protein [Longimicrobium sp.]|uniref:hypothetical protein n=1 Tax=Longimicrobium sp. TaxID=2029185 RepID=UPI002D7FA36B|nr:hypothetical protein [Longimicrobium sp.]